METRINEVLDKESLIESRLETAGSLLASLTNLESKYLSILGSVQSAQELIKADINKIESLLSAAECNNDTIYKTKDQILQASNEINKKLSTIESNISLIDKTVESINQKSEVINKTYIDMVTVKDDLTTKCKDLGDQLDSLDRKSNILDKSLSLVLDKEMESQKLLKESMSVSNEMASTTKSLNELTTQLRRKIEELDVRIDKIEKIESNNVNAAEYYERAAKAYKEDKSIELDDLIKGARLAIEEIQSIKNDLDKYKSLIEDFIATTGIPSIDPSMSDKILNIETKLTNIFSGTTSNGMSLSKINEHIKAYESSWLGRLILRLLRLKPL